MSMQESCFNTAHVMDNEIVKASDFEFAFENLVTNVSKVAQMMLESNQDFVINGKVLPYSGMNVQVSPIFGVCKSTGIPFGRTETAVMEYGFEESENGRIDIIEVKGDWETYDNQQRAFNDPDTDVKTYQYVDTKKLMRPVYRIKKGAEGSSVAPEVDEGFVKLAEVVIRANNSTIEATDIKNITSDIAGVNNTDWTTEPAITYNIGYISDVNERFRVQHNSDGTHKDNVINSDSLDIGVNAKQINGNVLPIGGNVSIPTQTTTTTESIQSVVVKVAAVVTSLYNAYLKYGTYGFKGTLAISDIANSSDILTKPLSLSADGSGQAFLKIGSTTVLTINENGRLTTNGETASNDNDIVTKKVTDAIVTSVSSLADRVTTLEGLYDNTEYINGTLSADRYSYSTIDIKAATTANIQLSGAQTIDGVTLTNGQNVLVKNQTDKKENGIYSYSSNSAWSRITDANTPAKMKAKIFEVSNGSTNAGKLFYLPKVNFNDSSSFVSDDIEILEYFGSKKKIGNKVVVRESNGKINADVNGNVTGDVSGSSGSCTGNSATATKLETARSLGVALDSTTAKTFDGSDNVTDIPVSGILGVANGGTGQNSLADVTVGNATNATNASKVNILTSDYNGDFPLMFTTSVTEGNKNVYTDTVNHASYNPATNDMKVVGDVFAANTPFMGSVYSGESYANGYFLLAQLSGSLAGNHDVGFSGVVYEDKAGTPTKTQFRIYARGTRQTIYFTIFKVIGSSSIIATYETKDTNEFVIRLYAQIKSNWHRYTTVIEYASTGDVSGRTSNRAVSLPGTYTTTLIGTEITKTNELTKSDVGLGNVDNTSDSVKSVSYAASAGSAGSATSAASLDNFQNNNSTGKDANEVNVNAHTYYTSNGPSTSLGASTSDGALYSQAYSDIWVGQIAQDYRTGRLFVRGKNNGTWQNWLNIIDSGNIGNQTVATAGSSGSCTGNAATATKLETARNLGVALGSTTAKTFDGSDNVTDIPVSGILGVANGGTGQTSLANVTVGKASNSDQLESKTWRQTALQGVWIDVNTTSLDNVGLYTFEPSTPAPGSTAIVAGSVVRVCFRYALQSSVKIEWVKFSYGGQIGKIVAARNNTTVALQSHVFIGGNYSSTYKNKVWDAYTTLELMWTGSEWLVMGNPDVCKYFSTSQSYTVKANGYIEQWANLTLSSKYGNINFYCNYTQIPALTCSRYKNSDSDELEQDNLGLGKISTSYFRVNTNMGNTNNYPISWNAKGY